jgi:peptide/nickel transport system permease protein
MNRIAKLSRLLALMLVSAAAFSDFLAPCPPDVLDLNQFFAPPSRIHFLDAQGEFHWRPFVYRMELADLEQARYRERMDHAYPLEFFCAGYRYLFLGFIPASIHLVGCRSGGSFHPWGTDDLGRDVLARTLAGARSSLLVLLLGLAVCSAAGVAVGACAGMLGGWVDTVLMRFSEFVLALPALYLVLALQALLPPRMPGWLASCLAAGTIAAVTWPPLARGVRGLILQVQNDHYVEAARVLGASGLQVFRRHVLPALAPFTLAQITVIAPVFILGEVILSFLNVGIQGSTVSWGGMLRGLMQHPRELHQFWWNLSPLGFVFMTLFCLVSLGRHTRVKSPAQLP